MAELAYQQADVNGLNVAFQAASAGGDTVRPATRGMLLVRNGDAAGHTVTIAVPGNTKFGQPEPDVVSQAIPAGGTAVFLVSDQDLADPADGLVHFTYDAATSVTVAAVRG